ncbi:helix-turn-helix transcriptional regulator [Enterococcus sp. HY326]|uniref:helix-turn-helix transcriptional regulator n=1 Tax=Enterococcus sp. HY326 TaxID=2971265 RepID=UPI00223FC605|nr:helix-turn-helix transcriptional regulator [Enterococcus sp. HY326]
MELNQTLRENRQKHELTQQQLADKLFVSNKTISNWETGKTLPDIESLIRLANLFDLSLDNLLLEGSDIVEDIKKKERAFALQRALTFGPELTNILLFIFLFLPGISNIFYMSDAMYVVLLAIIISNGYGALYFMKEKRQYRGTEFESKRSDRMSTLYVVIGVIVCVTVLSLKFIF